MRASHCTGWVGYRGHQIGRRYEEKDLLSQYFKRVVKVNQVKYISLVEKHRKSGDNAMLRYPTAVLAPDEDGIACPVGREASPKETSKSGLSSEDSIRPHYSVLDWICSYEQDLMLVLLLTVPIMLHQISLQY